MLEEQPIDVYRNCPIILERSDLGSFLQQVHIYSVTRHLLYIGFFMELV